MLGFGMIFYGLDLMGSALKTITEFDGFKSAMLLVENTPVLGVVMGALLTVIVQSSSATIGLLQELFTTGMIPMVGAVAIVLGSNIGTTVTAILAAIGGSTAAKRTATVHVIFNVLGSLLFLILIWPYSYLITYLQEVFLGGVEQEMTISFAHIIFNLFNTIVMFFFINKLVAISKRIIPGEDFDIVTNVDTLEAHLVTQAPVLALENAKRVIVGMEDIVEKMYATSVKYSFTNNPKDLELGRRLEEMVDTIDHKVHDYLTKISVSSLDDKSAQNQSMYMDTIRDLERIADHAQNLFDFFEHRYDLKQTLNGEAENSLTTLYDYVYNSIQLAFKAFKDDDEDAASKVLEREEIIDKMVRDYRKQHILRINNNAKLGGDENLFVDILSNVERIGDHCQNIAINILQDSYYPDVVLLKDKNPA
jgi:phosphate:Na+ symporter